MGELQYAEVVAVAADDLQAHGQPLVSEAGRHLDRRVAGRRDVVAGLHPADVARELCAVDLGHVGLAPLF